MNIAMANWTQRLFPYLFEVVSFLAYTFPEPAQLMYLVEPAMVSDDDESNDEAFCQEQ
jgi:hypothetical protein